MPNDHESNQEEHLVKIWVPSGLLDFTVDLFVFFLGRCVCLKSCYSSFLAVCFASVWWVVAFEFEAF